MRVSPNHKRGFKNLIVLRITESIVGKFVQAYTAINLQHIRDVVCDRRCCAYSIFFDAATNRENAYLDARLRVTMESEVEKFHIVAIPLKELWSGQLIFTIVSEAFNVLLGNYSRVKLIASATDGARDMTGIEKSSQRASGSLPVWTFLNFWVWCAKHQLDFSVQAVLTVIKYSFCIPLLSIFS